MRNRGRSVLSEFERAESGTVDYWVISNPSLERVLMLDCDGADVLPVFSFEEEALLYARYGTQEVERDVVRRSGDEILDLLLTGECRDADVVALDPVPEFRHVQETLHLTLIPRDSFIGRLFGISA